MKKFALVAALALAATAASAGVTGFATYDYDNATGSSALKTMTELQVGAALGTKFGTFDASLVGGRLHSVGFDDALGFEVGYTNGIDLKGLTIKGRAAYGRLNQVDTTVGGFKGNTAYYSLAAEAQAPLTKDIGGFISYRHRNGVQADTPSAANRFAIGADFKLGTNLGLRAGVSHTRQEGQIFNGVTTAVSFKF